MKQKILSLLLVGVMAISLVACGNSKETTSETTSNSSYMIIKTAQI